MDKCPICTKNILSHAIKLRCAICSIFYHMKCISIDPVVISQLEADKDTWYCHICLTQIFPYNNIDSNEEFISTTTASCLPSSLSCLSEKLFMPFELNDSDYLASVCNEDIDPDLHFFNSFNQHVANCNYLTEASFSKAICTPNLKKQSLSICHLNIRSIRKNLTAFENYVDMLQYEFPIIGFTETWLSDNDYDLYDIAGYNMIENHRSNQCGGGVAICVKEGIEYTVRSDLVVFNEVMESVYVEIEKSQFSTSKNIIIGTIYRKPDSDIRNFIDSLSLKLNKLSNENKLVYLLGDFNINLLNTDSHVLTGEFVDMMYSHHLFPLISRPTRITQLSATLIDNIFTNNINNFDSSINGILVTDISDHFPIFHINYLYISDEIDSVIITRVFNEKNKRAYRDTIASINWDEIYSGGDTQSSFDFLHNKLMSIHDKCFPKTKIRKKYSNRKPWLSDTLRNSIKFKNKLYHDSKRIPCTRTEKQYKLYKSQLNRELKVAEKTYYKDLLLSNKDNMRKTWSIIKNIIGTHKKTCTQKIFKLNDGSTTDNKKIISDKFNDFFINVGPNLAKAIPTVNKTPLYCMKNKIFESMFIEPVTQDEIVKLIGNLKDSACGWDELSTKFIKLSLECIVAPITHICNQSLQEGIFPQQLKIANVIPLYKSDDPMHFNHYRPVSLLCILSKVFEKIMYDRLLKFLEKMKIIYEKQFGFRKYHSTYMALMILMDKITKSLDDGEFVVGVFLDFSKAFDTVNHHIMLQKLEYYGIRGPVLKWFESYLSSRSQFVTYNGEKSSMKNVICGVPQGSILGPLLFLIYINDLSNVCEYMMPLLFADDTNLFNSGKDCNIIQNEIETDLLHISEWLKINKLSLNIKKTQFMIFTNKNSSKPNIDLKIDGHKIEQTLKTKFLGVIIDSQLTWKYHINYICGKIARGIGIIIKARKLLNRETLITLYYSFIYPYLQYCNHVWGSTCITFLKKLHVLQKRIVRVIAGAKPREHSEPLFKNLNILSIFQINVYAIGKFMYKVYHRETLNVFISMFKENSSVHRYPTRQASQFHPPLPKKELRKSSLCYRGALIWNKIMSCEVRTNVSQPVFSGELKKYIINNDLQLRP